MHIIMYYTNDYVCNDYDYVIIYYTRLKKPFLS